MAIKNITKAEMRAHKALSQLNKVHTHVTSGDVARLLKRDRSHVYRLLMALVEKKAAKRIHCLYYQAKDLTPNKGGKK